MANCTEPVIIWAAAFLITCSFEMDFKDQPKVEQTEAIQIRCDKAITSMYSGFGCN